MLLRAHLFVSKRCQGEISNSVLIAIAVMAGIVIVVIVVVGEAGAAEHCLAKIVRFNVLPECLGDMKTENIASAAEHCWILSAVRAREHSCRFSIDIDCAVAAEH